MWLIVVGVFVHVVFLMSIFDIYFKSPIVHGMVPQVNDFIPPAKRIVLFVADGLRAESFFYTRADGISHAPYLRRVMNTSGAWGVSHTRVPTESRPGHVALIAGLYEDPSAVAKGWKENPVEFDSVFNRSRFTWSWGSPDILPMFAKGATGRRVRAEMYDAALEDFSGRKDTRSLDTWVFDRVEAFLRDAGSSELQQDGTVFFLHLLGLDTAGHTYKPHSREYLKNIKCVDEGVERINKLMDKYFGYDNKTAYIFTSDHGMTDWGSHGAGEASETETPLVAWGAGIRGPRAPSLSDAPSPEDWRVGHLSRRDVRQADIAPLMATLIGVPIPVNSVGSLPKSYLDLPDLHLAEAMFTNARQMAAQFDKKRETVERKSVSWLYRPFPHLTEDGKRQLESAIRGHINAGRYEEATRASELLLSLSLRGLDYYQTYYQRLLLASVSALFLGCVAWLLWLLAACPQPARAVLAGGAPVNAAFAALLCLSAALIHVQELPYQFYVYCLLPQLLWWSIARRRADFHSVAVSIVRCYGVRQFLCSFFVYVIGIEILVLSFHQRRVLAAGTMGLAAWLCASSRGPWGLKACWVGSCAVLAAFPLLPVVGRGSDPMLVTCSGLLWVFAALVYLYWILTKSKYKNFQSVPTLWLQVTVIAATVWNIGSIANSFEEKQGLPLVNQLLSWFLSGLSLVLPLYGAQHLATRLVNICLSLVVPFLLLSTLYEGLFIFALTSNLSLWLALECSTSHLSPLDCVWLTTDKSVKKTAWDNPPTSSDFRRAYFILFYTILSFFGTGNIASINSFDPTWVRSFVTVFSPFVMTALILVKAVIPFLVVGCFMKALDVLTEAPVGRLFLVLLLFCDAMGLHFLHMVTNTGSWLDIGTSVSHFVIMQATTLLLVLLHRVAHLLVTARLPRLPRPGKKAV
ncbi:GPI ethanolamine phosphate transferase 1 [Bacillus rossius redtenbacheri]|uniref:GPI ethanolamine phosphate transferase 1 n=1 Tax=Bacillus rossius redtenbacheri TaxID=93214 RepID=UPI002FDD9890